MPAAPAAAPLLDPDNAAFIESGVSIAVCSSDLNCRPSVARGWGCRVSSDRREVSLFVSPMQAGALLGDLRAGRPVAVVFSLPSSHRTIQLKAVRVSIEPCNEADRAAVARYVPDFAADLDRVGYGGSWAESYLQVAAGPLVRVRFRPDAAFAQTPGPRAGEPLRS